MSDTMPRILVTGGAGYIGSILVPHLLHFSYRVRVLDKFTHPNPSLMSVIDHEGFEPVRGDCRDKALLRKCLKDVDYVIPLAAVVGAPACDNNPSDAESINAGGIIALAEQILETSCETKILYPNSNSAYGKTPLGEAADEDSKVNPLSLYAKTKMIGETALLESLPDYSTSFRLATAFGPSPKMRLDLLVNDFVYRAMRDKSLVLFEPHFRRNFIHVYDIARLFAFGIKNFDKLKGKVWNAGLHYGLTKEELCQTIQKKLKDFRYFVSETGEDPDRRDYNISTERLENIGFKCSVSLERGIRELIKAYSMLPVENFRNA